MTKAQLPARNNSRLSHWLTFPRRLLFLLFAGLLTFGIISIIRAAPAMHGGSFELDIVILLPLQNSFRLLSPALLLAFLFSLLTLVIASFVLRLEARHGFWGGFLRAFGRLWVFSDIAAPPFTCGIFLLFLFALKLRWLPLGGMLELQAGPDSGLLRHLVLPVLALLFVPSGLSALSAARRMHASAQTGLRRWAGAILRLLAALLRQTGGILGALVLVETVFNWPGMFRFLLMALKTLVINPVFFNILLIIVGLVLLGRIFSDLFEWLAALVDPAAVEPTPPDPRQAKARRGWLIFTLVLVAAAFILFIIGSLLPADAVTTVDPAGKLDGPSAAHLLGTDMLGRDLLARIFRGAANTFRISLTISLIVSLVAFPVGWFASWLARRRQWGFALLSDLLLLPADAFLLLPAIGAYILFFLLNMEAIRDLDSSAIPVILTSAAVLLPRATRFTARLWADAPAPAGILRYLSAGFSLFFSTMFMAFSLVTAVSMIGFGLRPPTASLGVILAETMQTFVQTHNAGILAPLFFTWFFLWALFLAAEALVEGWQDKSAFSWLNS